MPSWLVTASFNNLFQHSQYCQVPIRNWWRIAGCLRGWVTPGTEARHVEARDVLESWSYNICPKNKQIKPFPRSVFIPTIRMRQNAVTNFWRMARIVHEFNSLKFKFFSANCHELSRIFLNSPIRVLFWTQVNEFNSRGLKYNIHLHFQFHHDS